MAKKVALGKGIASLISDIPNQVVVDTLKNEFNNNNNLENNSQLEVNVSSIVTNPAQPRKIFKEKELEELANSIKENGIIQPLIVSKNGDGTFELVAGERRLRAAKKIKLKKVPIVIKQASDKDKMLMSIIENVQRADLNCVEEALAYYQLMDEFKLTQEEVAKKLGKERSTIANFLRILKLPRQIIDLVQKDFLSFGHAKILASVKDRELTIRLANEVIASELSVRELEKLAKNGLRSKKSPNRELENTNTMESLRESLEKKTGFHFALKSKANGSGQITIKFSNEAEFNDIYDHLTK